MTVVELAELVAGMREWQRKYSCDKDPTALSTCKTLERKVDAACAGILNPPARTLFDDLTPTGEAQA